MQKDFELVSKGASFWNDLKGFQYEGNSVSFSIDVVVADPIKVAQETKKDKVTELQALGHVFSHDKSGMANSLKVTSLLDVDTEQKTRKNISECY